MNELDPHPDLFPTGKPLIVNRALRLMHLKGESGIYVGMGLHRYGYYFSEPLRIVHTQDGLGVQLNGQSVYHNDTRGTYHTADGELINPDGPDEFIADSALVQATLEEISRHMILDELADI